MILERLTAGVLVLFALEVVVLVTPGRAVVVAVLLADRAVLLVAADRAVLLLFSATRLRAG